MKFLKNIGVVKKNSKSKSTQIFESFTGDKTFLDLPKMSPHEYVAYYWNKYMGSEYCQTETGQNNNSLNGQIFELIIYTLLYKENLVPFYAQASVAFVPGIEYDTILYSKERPICLSLKTSLRERYKQADLESIALKYVHRKAECYLLTLDKTEADNVNNKIKEGTAIGINHAYYCMAEEFDDFIKDLKQNDLCVAGSINIIDGRLIQK